MLPIYRTHLANSAKTKALLSHIAAMYAQRAGRLVLKVEGVRLGGETLSNVLIDADAADDNISFQRPYTEAVAASLALQDLTYTADTAGTAGNSVTVQYVDDGTAGAETASVVGSAITVHIESGVSTATQVKAAVDASAPASALISVAVSGTAGTAQVTAGATSLAGGKDIGDLKPAEYFDTADIKSIKRLRSKKFSIEIERGADNAQATI